ncbi:MAG: YihY family inner membrane protein [Planctomycetes bacterium]|nr:YihY family inner membrane protein [Planctomycetota bacterium]MCC7170614.1 YihY family inner membrane protein [Planctomycetota bacterium]
MVVQGLLRTEGFIRAAALTYITVLSLVPFLALGFSVAKGLGAYEKLRGEVVEPFLNETFPPDEVAATPTEATNAVPPADGTAVPQAEPKKSDSVGTRQAIEKVLEFVEKTGFGNLGAIGLLFLMLAAQKLLTSIEQAFNRIWGIRKSRSWIRKLTDYTALIVVTPILLLVATTLGSALQTEKVQGLISKLPGAGVVMAYVVPLLVLWIGFTFLYVCLPNTKVPIKSAFIGGIVGGTLWYLFQILHVRFQVGVAGYNAIYAGFAAFPIFLAWLYSVFVIVLVGGLVAWAHEHEPMHSTLRRAGVETLADRELVAVRAVRAIAAAFADGRGLMPEDELATRCAVPISKLAEVLDPLVEAGLLAHVNEGRTPGWLPTRPLDAIRVQDVLDGLRGARAKNLEGGDEVAAIVDGVRTAAAGTSANVTLSQIAANR